MCRHAYEHPGERTSGANIPGYAQGAYFPGDEPGTRCKLTGEACGNPQGDTPGQCVAAKRSPWICPNCRELGFETRLLLLDGSYHCEGCGESWSEAQLACEYAERFDTLYSTIDSRDEENQNLRDQREALREKLYAARAALAEVA